ncbi:MAG: mechanosensitive ion channel family protein [Gammaproteobacteria bacterium]|nr:mechanosensitive ion channel family protein [Gammaproteobacteria bacterium]
MPALPDWIPEPVTKTWQLLDNWPIIGALIITVLAYIAGKIAVTVITRVLGQITARTNSTVDDQLLSLIRRPVFLTVFFFGLSIATLTLGLPDAFEQNLLRLLRSILILVWAAAAFPFVHLVLENLGNDNSRFKVIEARTLPLFDISSKLLIFAVAGYMLLKVWGIDATAWLASAGVLGLALGFAAKDTLANLFSGFFIVADAPYQIGDYIVLDSGERGRVTNVGIRSTRILTRDDIEITLPNALIANGKIVNQSGGPHVKQRLRIKVGAAYGSDVDEVCSVLQSVAEGHADVCSAPQPRVRMRGFGASSLDFELLCWVEEPELSGRMSHDLYMRVYKAFAAAGIEIPFDKHDVYVKEFPASKREG